MDSCCFCNRSCSDKSLFSSSFCTSFHCFLRYSVSHIKSFVYFNSDCISFVLLILFSIDNCFSFSFVIASSASFSSSVLKNLSPESNAPIPPTPAPINPPTAVPTTGTTEPIPAPIAAPPPTIPNFEMPLA